MKLKQIKAKFEKLPSICFIILGLGVFGLLFFLGTLLVAFVHSLIPIYGIMVPLGLFFIIACVLDIAKETDEKMAKWKEDNPYNYEYYEKRKRE